MARHSASAARAAAAHKNATAIAAIADRSRPQHHAAHAAPAAMNSAGNANEMPMWNCNALVAPRTSAAAGIAPISRTGYALQAYGSAACVRFNDLWVWIAETAKRW